KDAAGHEGQADGAFMRFYLAAVRATTKVWQVPGLHWLRIPNYYLTVLGAIGVVVVSVILMLQVPGGLFPPEDESRIAISVELPAGSSLQDTAASTEAMRQAIADVDHVERVIVVGGSSPLGDRDIR